MRFKDDYNAKLLGDVTGSKLKEEETAEKLSVKLRKIREENERLLENRNHAEFLHREEEKLQIEVERETKGIIDELRFGLSVFSFPAYVSPCFSDRRFSVTL